MCGQCQRDAPTLPATTLQHGDVASSFWPELLVFPWGREAGLVEYFTTEYTLQIATEAGDGSTANLEAPRGLILLFAVGAEPPHVVVGGMGEFKL